MHRLNPQRAARARALWTWGAACLLALVLSPSMASAQDSAPGCNVHGCWEAGGGCNMHGCWGADGGCNMHGCWRDSGGCNMHGCWHGSEGACNMHGCSNVGECSISGCPPEGATDEPRHAPDHPMRRCVERLVGVPDIKPGCDVHGCWEAGGGCNLHGCWRDGGGCNLHGCWNSPVGSCNLHGCSDVGECSLHGCPEGEPPTELICSPEDSHGRRTRSQSPNRGTRP